MPWRFKSSYPHHGFGVVAQLIERYVRIVEVVGLYGGMVDAEDLKSFGYCNRVGSSPTIPTKDIKIQVQHCVAPVFFMFVCVFLI